MQTINRSQADAFLKRFWSFYDGKLCSVLIRWEKSGEKRLAISLDAKDYMNVEAGVWSHVKIEIIGLQEAKIFEPECRTLVVLSDGIHLRWFDGGVGIEFGQLPEPPMSVKQLRQSYGYAIGQSLEFQVYPITNLDA